MAESPDEFERVRLILARQRRLGAAFDEAWPMALAALDRPTKGERDAKALAATFSALEATRPAWRAAWRREPPPPPAYGRAATEARLRELQRSAITA